MSLRPRFIKYLPEEFVWNADEHEKYQEQNDRFAKFLVDPVLKQLNSVNIEFDKARVEVINQSQNVVTGIRLRFDRVFYLWRLDISGTFLQKIDAESFKATVKYDEKGRFIVLPELPPIPPNSSIVLTLYGNLDLLDTTIATAGRSYSVTDIVEVEGGLIIDVYQRPYFYLILLGFTSPLILLLFGFIWMSVSNRIVKTRTKTIFYDEACDLAINNKPDDAMVMLRQAVEAGYSDKRHVLDDEDLEKLRDRKDFLELFK